MDICGLYDGRKSLVILCTLLCRPFMQLCRRQTRPLLG